MLWSTLHLLLLEILLLHGIDNDKTSSPSYSTLLCVSCILETGSGIHHQEEAKKALESALGGKKSEFEKWDKEIKRREDAGGGGNSGGGGWFGWFSGSNGDHFWQEAQQISLTILGIIIMVRTCISSFFVPSTSILPTKIFHRCLINDVCFLLFF